MITVIPTNIRLTSGKSLKFSENDPSSCISDLCEIEIDLKLEDIRHGSHIVDVVLQIMNTGLFRFKDGTITDGYPLKVTVNYQGEGKVTISNLSFIILSAFEDLKGLDELVLIVTTSYHTQQVLQYPRRRENSIIIKTEKNPINNDQI